MPSEWSTLRNWDGSQHAAFEELVCQLVGQEKQLPDRTAIPSSARFARVSPPDAGKECYWEFPDSSYHCWQAKFFDELGDSQITQLKDSFSTALQRHPTMRTFVVAAPLDRTDGRDSQAPVPAKKRRGRPRKSQMDRWTDFVAWCESESRNRSRTVAVHYWGKSEIFSRLSQAEHAGRRTFWFAAPDLGLDLLGRKLDAAKKTVGKRYTPESNTEVSIAHHMRALRFDDRIVNGIQERVREIASKVADLCRHPEPSHKDIIDKVRKATSLLEKQSPTIAISNARTTVDEILQHLIDIRQLIGDLYDVISTEAERKAATAKETTSRESYDYDRYKCDQVYIATRSAQEWIDNVVSALLKGEPLLLAGEAGTGKTHLFIDQCKEHLISGGGAIVLFGQKVQSDRTITDILCRELELSHFSLRDLLALLNSFGQASGKPFLVLMDALNESPLRDSFWNQYLPDFLLEVQNFPYIRMAVSIRTDFVRLTLTQQLIDSFVWMSHPGFEGVEYEAVKAYFRHYEIDLTTPPLNPEFSNPLFLKIYCEALHRAGIRLSPDGLDGLYSIFNMLIEEMNEKISRDLKMRPDRKLVNRALDRLAGRMGTRRFLPEAEAMEVVEDLYKGANDDQSLYYSMISEGLLAQVVGYGETGNANQTNVALSFDRFTDLVKAMSIVPTELTDESRASLRLEIERLLEDDHAAYLNRSLLSALSLVLPERHPGVELIDVLTQSHDKVKSLIAPFLYSAIWRTAQAMTDRTVELWWSIKNREHEAVFDDLLLMALRQNHPLNALELDRMLRPMNMHDRDLAWSNSIDRLWGGFAAVGGYDRRAIHRLVDWALQHPDPSRIPDDVRFLWATALSWMFSTSNRIARDFATKALARLLENRLALAEKLCRQFVSPGNCEPINDPYVLERIMCASYGAAMRSHNADGLGHLAQLSYDFVFGPSPQCDHVLIRDYSLGLISLALTHGNSLSVDLSRIEPPFDTVGFDPSLTTGAIKKKYDIEGATWDEGFRAAWSQIAPDVGDFGIYQVSRAIREFEDYCGEYREGEDLHSIVPAWMLECMIEMGWAPDFEEVPNIVNHHRPYSRHDQSKPESLTKKYAWIALHRAEGILADHYKIKDGWGSEAVWRNKQGPWEGYRRDLDPSLMIPLEQTSGGEDEGTQQWFPAGTVMPDWRPDVDDEAWMSDPANLPRIDKILAWTLADGAEYLMLQSFKTERQSVLLLDSERKPSRDSYLFVWSYFVPKTSSEEAYKWFKGQDYFQKWMPEARSSTQAFVGEIAWHPASDPLSEVRQYIPPGSHYFSFRGKTPPPCELLITSDEYSWGSSYDTTCRTDFNFLVPCHRLIRSLDLRHHGELPIEISSPLRLNAYQEAALFDAEGRCVAFSPNVYRSGPSALFISRESLLRFMKEEGLALCWTFLGERCSYVRDTGAERVIPPGEAIINGAGMLTCDGNLEWDVRCAYRPI